MLFIAIFTHAQSTTTVKSLPPSDTIKLALVGEIQAIYGEFSNPRIEQDVTIIHPSAEKLLPIMVASGRYNFVGQQGEYTTHPNRQKPVTMGGVDMEERVITRLYVPRGTTVIRL